MDKRNYLNDVKLELTSACNKDCSFCYLKTRKKRLDTPYTKNELFSIVDKLHKQNILNVRLSGGEPLMYENLEELLGYLKKKQFRVGLVTNGELITDRFLKDSRGRIDYLCVSFHQLKNRKIIDRLERHDVAYSLNTILSASNVRLLDKFHKFVAGLSRARSWNLLRELLFAGINIPEARKNIAISIEKILEYRRKSKIKISIGNPVPFCAYDPDKVSRVSNYKCSIFNLKKPSDFTIDFDGSISPCSLLDLDLGSFLEMRSPGLLKRKDRFASLQDSIMPVLPEPCRDCDLFKDCGSACRAVSRIIYNDYKHLDYLADPEKYL